MGAASLALGLGSSIGAAIRAARAEREQRRKTNIIEQQHAGDRAMFNKQYYQDIANRTEIQNLLRTLSDNQKNADTRDSARSAVMGVTQEQELASKEGNRRRFADSLADIASNASNMRDRYLRDYTGQRNQYYAHRLGMQDQLSNIETNAANQWSTAANNAFLNGAKLLGDGIENLGKPRPASTTV